MGRAAAVRRGCGRGPRAGGVAAGVVGLGAWLSGCLRKRQRDRPPARSCRSRCTPPCPRFHCSTSGRVPRPTREGSSVSCMPPGL
jgi:hypothetical protein